MKMLKKLALVSAVSMISAGAFAMEAMDDASMAATTGQDGITVKIKPPTNLAYTSNAYSGPAGELTIDSLYIHDKGGLAAAAGGTDTSGAIVLGKIAGVATNGMSIAGATPIQLDIDADGGTGGAAPLLNIKVTLPAVFVVKTGDISVAASNRAVGAITTDRGIVAVGAKKILNSIELSLGGTIMNIQLGNEAQASTTGAGTTMIKVTGSIANGLSIAGLQLDDSAGVVGNLATAAGFGKGQGSVYVDKITITDSGVFSTASTADDVLTLATDIDISDFGLIMKMGGSLKTDILMENVRLGATGSASMNASIGDVEIVGLNTIGMSIAVSGH